MIKLIRRVWRYLVAVLTGRFKAAADPRIQLEQAIQEAKERHQRLSQHAASVIGHEKGLRLKLDQAVEESVKLEENAAKALDLADRARAAGDEEKAKAYEASAQAFATKLVAVEATVKSLRASAEEAAKASAQARDAVETNALQLQKMLAEQQQLLSQLEQAKMQEQLNESLASMSELRPEGEVPTIAEIREKVQNRLARAQGEAELTQNSVEARMLEVERATIDAEGAARLDAIRRKRALPADGTDAPTPQD